jgi:tetratricopeptide (TPR) repeat protein
MSLSLTSLDKVRRTMARDTLGNEVTTTTPVTLAGIDDFVSGFLGYERKAANVVAAADADPESVIASVYAAWTWMCLEAAGARRQAARYLRRAQAAATEANKREAMLVAQLERWLAGDIPAVQAMGDAIIARWPTDLASVKLHQYFSFNRGDAVAMLRVAEAALPANAGNPHLYGMLAFGYEQMHRIPEAEAAARTALGLKQKEPWAQHALAHVMLSSGRTREGVSFLHEASRTWVDLNSFMYTHNWWHKALFHISLGDSAAVFDAYDNHVWGIEPDYRQDQVGAVSLLARMEVAGMDVGNRWEDVAEHMKTRARDTLQPFLTLQYLYGLARAERAEADTLMMAIEDKAATTTAFDRVVWHDVALPAARGMLAHARRDYAAAARWLTIANPRLQEIGGSHAQRDLFGQLLLDAHVKIGNWKVAFRMLEMRRTWDPDGVPLMRMLAEAHSHLAESAA